MACPDLDKSSELVVCKLCEEVEEASHHCDNCLANFCDRCAETHRKLATKGGCHRVEAGVCNYDMELELCPVDGQKMSFFCRTCRVRVCPECEMDGKGHVMHRVVSLTRLVGLEKEKLLEKLDDVTTKTETISHMPDDIKSMMTHIELKWLERKELVRQEFASLFETLTTQQQKLLADMEEEVNKSLEHLSQLHQDHDAVLSNTCQLSDECISAVQNLPRDQFMNSYPQFLESVKHLEQKVERMESAKDHMPTFLQVPFSLHKEKVHLHNCLQIKSFNLRNIKAREHHRFVPYNRLEEELSINSLLETRTSDELPPSSLLRYSVHIHCGSKQNKKPAWSSKKLLKAPDVVINGNHGHRLSPGNLYMVKIRPVINCSTHQGEQSVEGRLISIVIVTDSISQDALMAEPVMAAGDSQMTVPDTCGLLNTTFENPGEDHLSFTNHAAGASKCDNNSNNNNSNSRARLRNRAPRITGSRVSSRGQQVMDPFVSALPAFGGGARVPFGDGQYIPARVSYETMVPTAPEDTVTPVCIMSEGPYCVGFQSQKRYLADCSFEEARLMEDSSLKLSRMVLFDG
ncbi:uncharacterized protein LOC143302130 [Babylonia areolata]|uniref:uncharacterized protein LOC143302130 n=1 Tax=Babylonia areolata TaxID=304850 RepID=UPI003FD68C9A